MDSPNWERDARGKAANNGCARGLCERKKADLTRGRRRNVADDRNSREEWIVLQKQTTVTRPCSPFAAATRVGNRFCLTCHSSVYAFLYPIADISCLSCAFTSPWRVFHYLITFQKEPSVFLLLGRDPTVPASFNRITKGPGGGGIDDRAPRDPWIGAITSPREIWLSLVFFFFLAQVLKVWRNFSWNWHLFLSWIPCSFYTCKIIILTRESCYRKI